MLIFGKINNKPIKKTKMEKTIKLENYDYRSEEWLMDDIDLEITWVEMNNVDYEILDINKTEENSVVVKYKIV